MVMPRERNAALMAKRESTRRGEPGFLDANHPAFCTKDAAASGKPSQAAFTGWTGALAIDLPIGLLIADIVMKIKSFHGCGKILKRNP
jgi:hypothetical protein